MGALRFLPLLVMVFATIMTLFLRNWRHRRRHGDSGLKTRSWDNRARLGWGGQMVLLALLLGQAFATAFAPGWLAAIALPFPVGPEVQVGAGIFMLALVFPLLVAQEQMGASWRMGLDLHARPGLVTTGLFRVTRNPIYSLSLLGFLSYCAMMPTWLSVFVFCAGVVVFRFQVAQEEAHLLALYGDEYRAYAARVGRFIPGLGRLRG